MGREPIYVDDADVLTDGTSRQILRNNESGRKLECPGFVPKGAKSKGFFG